MRFLNHVATGLRALFSRQQVERELDEELQSYLDASIEQKRAAGLGLEEAKRAARLELGSLEATKDWVRDVGWESIAQATWQDASYAVRGLRRKPGYALAAILMAFVWVSRGVLCAVVILTALVDPRIAPRRQTPSITGARGSSRLYRRR